MQQQEPPEIKNELGGFNQQRMQVENEETSIKTMMDIIQQDQPSANANHRDPNWLKNNLENEEGVLQFLDDPNNQLEDQPTEVLIELAQKLKERRTKHYQEMLRVQEE